MKRAMTLLVILLTLSMALLIACVSSMSSFGTAPKSDTLMTFPTEIGKSSLPNL